MKINRKLVAIAAAVAVVAAGGVGIAYAVGGGDSEEQMTGPDAEKAKSAAIDAAGGGRYSRPSTRKRRAGFYEVEVQRPDGSVVEVHIDGQFQPVGTRRTTTPARRAKTRRTRGPRAPRTSSRRSPSRTPPSDQESGIEMHHGRGLAGARDRCASAVRRGDCLHDREAEAGPSLVRPPSARVKRSNAWDSNPGGNPAPWSETSNETARRRAARIRGRHQPRTGAHCRSGSRAPARPVGCRRPLRGSRGRRRRSPPVARATREPGSDPAQQLVEVHPLALDRQLALIGPGDHEQVLGQAREPIDLLDRRPESRPSSSRVRWDRSASSSSARSTASSVPARGSHPPRTRAGARAMPRSDRAFCSVSLRAGGSRPRRAEAAAALRFSSSVISSAFLAWSTGASERLASR